LMIKLFLLGVQPSTWKIIDELHQDTKTMVKWKQQTWFRFVLFISIITLSCGWSLYR
jgi:hypothetical protein